MNGGFVVFLSFIVFVLVLLFPFSVFALILNCVLISVYKKRAPLSDGYKKRYSIFRKQRKFSIIITVALFIVIIVVGFIGVNM